MLPNDVLAQLKTQTAFQTLGDTIGNLTIGRGKLNGAATHIAIIENRIASGSLSTKESDKLASLFKVTATQKTPLLMYIDSAGARVSEGLPALGAFRQMYRAALGVPASGISFTVFCGANCFGGASMLASLADTRYFSANTRFAMSGPAILAQSAGASVLDDMFQAMSHAAIGTTGRVKWADGDNAASVASSLAQSRAARSPFKRHIELGKRLETLPPSKASSMSSPQQKVERKDLYKLFPEGYELFESEGIVLGDATYQGERVHVIGIINGRPMGAAAAWRLADALWKMLDASHGSLPNSLHVLVDCESHSTSLEDERVVLSAFLADLAQALFALDRAGVRLEATILGKLGGGVYVAIAAPIRQLNLLYGTEIQLLPGAAIASILGGSSADKFAFADYQKSRVAEQELKLGIV